MNNSSSSPTTLYLVFSPEVRQKVSGVIQLRGFETKRDPDPGRTQFNMTRQTEIMSISQEESPTDIVASGYTKPQVWSEDAQ